MPTDKSQGHVTLRGSFNVDKTREFSISGLPLCAMAKYTEFTILVLIFSSNLDKASKTLQAAPAVFYLANVLVGVIHSVWKNMELRRKWNEIGRSHRGPAEMVCLGFCLFAAHSISTRGHGSSLSNPADRGMHYQYDIESKLSLDFWCVSISLLQSLLPSSKTPSFLSVVHESDIAMTLRSWGNCQISVSMWKCRVVSKTGLFSSECVHMRLTFSSCYLSGEFVGCIQHKFIIIFSGAYLP